MAEVKWIKIVTDIFDDEKIKLIESLPDGDSIIVIWFKILCLAGKQNNGGVFMMNDRIAYTDEMLATIFRRPINIVRLALNTFEQFGMIEIINGVITIPHWNKHQSLDVYNNKLEYDREYQRKRRLEKKSYDCRTTSYDGRILEEDKEEDKEREIDNIKKEDKKESYHSFGEYSNVRLTQEEYSKLAEEIPDVDKLIDELSGYIKSTGKAYKSHYATLRNWNRRRQEEKADKKEASYDLDKYSDKTMTQKLVYKRKGENESI